MLEAVLFLQWLGHLSLRISFRQVGSKYLYLYNDFFDAASLHNLHLYLTAEKFGQVVGQLDVPLNIDLHEVTKCQSQPIDSPRCCLAQHSTRFVANMKLQCNAYRPAAYAAFELMSLSSDPCPVALTASVDCQRHEQLKLRWERFLLSCTVGCDTAWMIHATRDH